MFRFAHPEYFYLLLVLPIIYLVYLYGIFRRKKNLKKYGDIKLLESLMPDVSRYKPHVKFYFKLFALLVLVFVIAGPQFGSKLESVKKQGVEIMIALDISNSMLAKDISPNRLEKSKQILSKLIDDLSNDKVGLIVFAGDAYTQLPITSDYSSAKMFLSGINPNMISSQGTAIGSAIQLASRSFSPNKSSDKAIIVITEGENHEGDAVEMAKQASEKGIKVDVVGIGSPEGVPIPMNEQSNDFRKDNQGNVVISKLNETMGQQIAEAGKGIYVRADNTNNALRALLNEVRKMKKTDLESNVYSEYDEQYQSLAWIVLILLLVDIFILDRKNSLMKKFDFFS